MRNTDRARRCLEALPHLALVVCSALTEPLPLLLFALSATALHELGHLALLAALDAGASELRFVPFGLRITPRGRLLSHVEEAAVALSGPTANLAAVLICYLVFRLIPSNGALCFGGVNMLLAALNLLPVSGFDGGRALSGALSHFVSPRAAALCLDVTSILIASLGCFFGLFLLMRGGGGLYLFSLSLALLLREIFASSSPLEKQEKKRVKERKNEKK